MPFVIFSEELENIQFEFKRLEGELILIADLNLEILSKNIRKTFE